VFGRIVIIVPTLLFGFEIFFFIFRFEFQTDANRLPAPLLVFFSIMKIIIIFLLFLRFQSIKKGKFVKINILI